MADGQGLWSGLQSTVGGAAGVAKGAVQDAASFAKASAGRAADAAAIAALSKSVDALDEAVRVLRERRLTYDVTLSFNAGPFGLSVTLPGEPMDASPSA